MSTIVVQKVNLAEGIKIPIYTNATRPSSGNTTGDLIYNSTIGKCQLFYDSVWNDLDFEA
jgi:hypothetical protein